VTAFCVICYNKLYNSLLFLKISQTILQIFLGKTNPFWICSGNATHRSTVTMLCVIWYNKLDNSLREFLSVFSRFPNRIRAKGTARLASMPSSEEL
jgi:hypothetical protein